jgi:hypothetical protein
MNSTDFLKSKGLITDGFSQFIIKNDNYEIILNDLLDEYARLKLSTERLQTISIEKEIEPFLSDKVKGFWKNPLHDTGIDEDGKLHSCYMQIVVTKSIKKLPIADEPANDVDDNDIRQFANFINRAAELDLIHTGALCMPFKLRLAVLSPSIRTILCFFPATTISNDKLNALSNLFTGEGELGYESDRIINL